MNPTTPLRERRRRNWHARFRRPELNAAEARALFESYAAAYDGDVFAVIGELIARLDSSDSER